MTNTPTPGPDGATEREAVMSTAELVARLRSCTTSVFGEWEAARRLEAQSGLLPALKALEGLETDGAIDLNAVDFAMRLGHVLADARAAISKAEGHPQ